MPMVAPFIPIIASGIGAAVAARGMQQAKKAREAQAPLLNAQTQLAQQQAAIARLAGPAFTETSDYYRKLLHGDRAAMATALAPEITSITELSRGAERNLDRGPAGPQRDVAKAELGRQRVGQIGALFPQARRAGAEGLMNLGAMAQGGAGNAASIYQNLISGQRQDRQFQSGENERLGEGIGPLLVDFYKAWQQRGGGAAAGAGAGAGGLGASGTMFGGFGGFG